MGSAAEAWAGVRPPSLGDAIGIGIDALKRAGVPWTVRRRARKATEQYFLRELGLDPDVALETATRAPARQPMEPVPEPLLKPLVALMEAVVARDYEVLANYSRGRLEAEGIRRMVEDVYGGPLAMPPPEHYADALMDEEDPDEKGFFLDLWDGEEIADLHLTGYVQRREDGTFEPVLRDVAP
jgi:hypothetical protein